MRLTKATFACIAIYNARELEKALQMQSAKKPRHFWRGFIIHSVKVNQ